MVTIRSLVFAVVAVPTIALAQSNNIDLFSFVMSDAQLIAGAHVDTAKNSPFGQFVLAQIQPGTQYLQGFMSTTGIDPRSDVTEVLIASNGAAGPNMRWLAGARGTFSGSIETVEVNALKNGGTITRLPGVDLVTFSSEAGGNPPAGNVCIGLFTDGMTDVIGDCTSVQAAIQFGLVSAGPASPVGLKAQQLRAGQDLWFASVIPVSQFANLMPGGDSGAAGNLSGVLKNNLFQAIQQISGGVKFASASGALGAQFSAELMMDSPEHANSLLNVVNFIVGLLQMNASSVPAAESLVSLLSKLQTSVNGSTLNIGLSVPEATLEQLFEQIGQMALNHSTFPARQN